MSLISETFSLIKRAWKWIKKWTTGSGADIHVRAKKARIRKLKREEYSTRGRIQRIRRDIWRAKKSNEKDIRKLIWRFYEAQIRLIDGIVLEIISIQNDCFTHSKEIVTNVEANYRGHTPRSFYKVNTELHLQIAESKEIKAKLLDVCERLLAQKHILLNEKSPIYKPPQRLGGKTMIKGILADQRSALIEQTREREIIVSDDTRYDCRSRCNKCKALLPEEFRYCHICGRKTDNDREEIQFVKHDNDKVWCEKCSCEVAEDWEFCPNCGSDFDYYGFRGLLARKASRRGT